MILEITSGEFEQELGKLIRQEREKCCFSRKFMAEETGYSVYQIRKIEEGKGITISQLHNLAKALGLSTDFFLDKDFREDCLKMQVRWHRRSNDT